ncbi:MAG: hypothetical protein ACYDHY_06710 [Acidiferrobacterales bacterium]
MPVEMKVEVTGPNEGEHPSVMHIKFIPFFREWRFNPPMTFEKFDEELRSKINSFQGLPVNDDTIKALSNVVNSFISSLIQSQMIRPALSPDEPGAPV